MDMSVMIGQALGSVVAGLVGAYFTPAKRFKSPQLAEFIGATALIVIGCLFIPSRNGEPTQWIGGIIAIAIFFLRMRMELSKKPAPPGNEFPREE